MFGPIRLRLTLGYVGILALILVAFGLVVVVGFRGATVGQHDDVLLERAQTLADGVSRTGTVGGAMDGTTGPAPDGGRVIVAGERLDSRVEITVSDTGPGIAREQLPRVFDRFYRADTGSGAHARDGGGAGLGLTIARDLSRAQGGELSVDGGNDGGATFRLALPAGSRARLKIPG